MPISRPTKPIAKKDFRWRSSLFIALFIGAFGLLAARATYLQVFDQGRLQNEGEKRYARTHIDKNLRGRILDRNGVVLASSTLAFGIWMRPKEFVLLPRADKQKLASIINLSTAQLDKFARQKDSFVYIKRQQSSETAGKVRALNIAGIGIEEERLRQYPQGHSLTALLGVLNIDHLGIEGVEKAKNSVLAGSVGKQRIIRDRKGAKVEELAELQAKEDGHDVMLTIDNRVQYQAYSEIKKIVDSHSAKNGVAIVVDTYNGDILALVNYPRVDEGAKKNNINLVLRNRALVDVFEPGSTIKPFAVAAAMEDKQVNPDTFFNTGEGRIRIGDRTISDTKPHGRINVLEILQKSSNVGMVMMTQKLASQKLWKLYRDVGFGERLSFEYPGMQKGNLRTPQKWYPIDKAVMSYGHGLDVNLAQLAQAYTIFATDGTLLPLRLFREANQEGGVETETPNLQTSVISPNTARAVRTMLEFAVDTAGTGSKAGIPGYRVAGKTGTAKQLENGRYLKKYSSSFVGIVPASRPRFIMAVMIDNPSKNGYYGGEVAAPVFAGTMQFVLQTYGIVPDAAINKDKTGVVKVTAKNSPLPTSPKSMLSAVKKNGEQL